MKSTKKSKKNQYGPVDLLPEDAFNPKETKFRVTMFIDMDVLEEVRKQAKEKGLPYQTYINFFLRESHLGVDNVTSLAKRLEKLESDFKLKIASGE